MNSFFRQQLPELFQWLSTKYPHILMIPDEPDNIGMDLNSITFPYVIATSYRNKLSLHEQIKHPTGKEYFEKSCTSIQLRTWKERVIHLGKQN